jgi:hypothetical protein
VSASKDLTRAYNVQRNDSKYLQCLHSDKFRGINFSSIDELRNSPQSTGLMRRTYQYHYILSYVLRIAD